MAAGDLTTVEEVRAFLQKRNVDTAQDEVIQTLITAASATITRYTQRQFFRETATSKTFSWPGIVQPGFVTLAPFEIVSASSVTIDVDTDSPTLLSDDEFCLAPDVNSEGTFFGIELNPFGVSTRSARWGPRRRFTVKGDWGMDEIPADVAHWTNVVVSIWLKRDVASFSTGLKVDEGYVERPQMLPSAAMAGLDQWRRMTP